MATISRRQNKWRAQVRRRDHSLSRTFSHRVDAEKWAREMERAIDQDIDPTTRRFTSKDTFASLIDAHIDDLAAYGKRLRRSKDAVLRRLRDELGAETVASLSRERLIQYGKARAQGGAGPATLSIDFSFIGTILTHAASMHGLQTNLEAVKLARIALTRMGAIGAPRERDRRPTAEELETLFARFSSNQRDTMPMKSIVQFAIATAMRLDEIVRIEWKDFDERTRTIKVVNRKDPRRKEGNDQRVPLLDVTGYDAAAIPHAVDAATRRTATTSTGRPPPAHKLPSEHAARYRDELRLPGVARSSASSSPSSAARA